MNFEDAWAEMSDELVYTEKRAGIPKIKILFENELDGDCYATLVAPRFHRNRESVKDDVKRAWETFCRPFPEDRLHSITKISLIYADAA